MFARKSRSATAPRSTASHCRRHGAWQSWPSGQIATAATRWKYEQLDPLVPVGDVNYHLVSGSSCGISHARRPKSMSICFLQEENVELRALCSPESLFEFDGQGHHAHGGHSDRRQSGQVRGDTCASLTTVSAAASARRGRGRGCAPLGQCLARVLACPGPRSGETVMSSRGNGSELTRSLKTN